MHPDTGLPGQNNRSIHDCDVEVSVFDKENVKNGKN
jgi:hypothetical protein